MSESGGRRFSPWSLCASAVGLTAVGQVAQLAASSGGTSLAMLDAAVVAGSALVMGSAAVLGNLGASRKDREDASRLPDDSSELHANHDVQELVGLALQQALRSLSENAAEVPNEADRSALACIADATPEAFVDLCNRSSDAVKGLSDERIPNVITAAARKGATTGAEVLLTESSWGELLGELRNCAPGASALSDPNLPGRLAAQFPESFRQLAKHAEEGKGPGVRAAAGFRLLVLGRILDDLAELKADTGKTTAAVEALKRAVQVDLTNRIEALGQEERARHDSLVRWLVRRHKSIERALQSLEDLVAAGLESASEFSAEYWAKQERQRKTSTIWKHSRRWELRRRSFVGRRDELERVRSFLENDAAWVQCWRGMPGTGKSRFAIAAAELAAEHGWCVRFVTPGVHGVRVALERARQGCGRVLVIWDGFEGHPDGERLALVDCAGPGASGFVKVLFTCWPTLNPIADHPKDSRYGQEKFAILEEGREIVELLCRLHPALSEADARSIVEKAENHFETAIRALEQVVAGRAVSELGTAAEILRDSYAALVADLTGGGGRGEAADAPLRRHGLRVLSLVGSIDLSDSDDASMFRASRAAAGGRDWSAPLGNFVRPSRGILSLAPDGLRMYVVACHADPGDPMFEFEPDVHRVEDLVHLLVGSVTPFLPARFAEAWRVVAAVGAVAGGDDAPGAEARIQFVRQVKDGLLARLRGSIEGCDAAKAFLAAVRIGDAALGEPDRQLRERLAREIEVLLENFKSKDIAVALGRALWSTIRDETETHAVARIAARSQEVLDMYPSPELAFCVSAGQLEAARSESDSGERARLVCSIYRRYSEYRTEDLAVACNLALSELTVVERDPQQLARLAREFPQLDEQHRSVELAASWAGTRALALAKAASLLRAREELTRLEVEIRATFAAHATPITAHALALVLQRSALEPSGRSQLKPIVEEMQRLLDRFRTEEIARAYLCTLQSSQVLMHAPLRDRFVREILQVAERHRSAVVALESARALHTAIMGVIDEDEPDQREWRRIADEIRSLYERNQTPELAKVLAEGLSTIVVMVADPQEQLSNLDEIRELLRSHPTSGIEHTLNNLAYLGIKH